MEVVKVWLSIPGPWCIYHNKRVFKCRCHTGCHVESWTGLTSITSGNLWSAQNADCRQLGTKRRLQTADIVGTKCRLRIKTVFHQIHDSMSFYNLSSVMQSLFCGHLRRKLVLLKFIIGPFLHIKSSYISYLCT